MKHGLLSCASYSIKESFYELDKNYGDCPNFSCIILEENDNMLNRYHMASQSGIRNVIWWVCINHSLLGYRCKSKSINCGRKNDKWIFWIVLGVTLCSGFGIILFCSSYFGRLSNYAYVYIVLTDIALFRFDQNFKKLFLFYSRSL